MINIGTVIGWKFNHQAGMATVDGVITEFPNGIPSQADQDLWTQEYEAYLALPTKMSGVEFEGVLCSATSEDMWGLSAIKGWIESGNNVPFQFSNGSRVTLTLANITPFESVWIPFRASFFS